MGVKSDNRYLRVAQRSYASPALVAGGLYFLLAALTISLTPSGQGIATFWPANAVLLAMMLHRGRRHWTSILSAGYVANIAANVLARETWLGPIMLAFANIAEVYVAAVLLHRFEEDERILEKPISVARFIVCAGFLAPLFSSLLGALAAWSFLGQPFIPVQITWLASNSMGLLVCTPFFFALFSGEYLRCFRSRSPRRRLEVLGLQAIVLVVSLVVFMTHHLPVLFLLSAPMMVVTFRLGWLGTVTSVLIVAIVGSVATISGMGPISLAELSPSQEILFLQFLLTSLLLVQFPVSVVLQAKDQAIRDLHESEQSVQLIAGQSGILLLHFDPSGTCIKAVGTAEQLLGTTSQSLISQPFDSLFGDGGEQVFTAHISALDDPGRTHSIEVLAPHDPNLWLEARFRASYDESGQFRGSFATLQDVTSRKRDELALTAAAETDHLTGVLNRKGFMNRLHQLLDGPFTASYHLAMIDVDRFKMINDNFGHLIGDEVLKVLGERMSAQLRGVDAVGRLGGDEFAILLMTPDRTVAQNICSRIVDAVGSSSIGTSTNQRLELGISCGLAQYRDGMSKEAWLHEADTALYRAKREGRNRLVAA